MDDVNAENLLVRWRQGSNLLAVLRSFSKDDRVPFAQLLLHSLCL